MKSLSLHGKKKKKTPKTGVEGLRGAKSVGTEERQEEVPVISPSDEHVPLSPPKESEHPVLEGLEHDTEEEGLSTPPPSIEDQEERSNEHELTRIRREARMKIASNEDEEEKPHLRESNPDIWEGETDGDD